MALTKKTTEEFAIKSLDWGIFEDPGMIVAYMGRTVPPKVVPNVFPLRRSVHAHHPDFHAAEEEKDINEHTSTTAIERLKRKISHVQKHSMSITLRCAFFRFPVMLWPKAGSKVCCLDLEIMIPGPYQPPLVVSKYLSLFSKTLTNMSNVLKVRILIRVERAQPLSADKTITHEEYLYSLFQMLGANIRSIRDLTVVVIQTTSSSNRKFQAHGVRGAGEINFNLKWRDSIGSFDEHGNGLDICIRDRSGYVVRDSHGDLVKYHVGGVSRDEKGRLLLDFNGHLVRDSITSNVRDSKGRFMSILWDGSLLDTYGKPLRDMNGNILHLGDRGELTDAADNVLLSNFAAAFDDKGNIKRDSRGNPIMQLPGDVFRNSNDEVFVQDDNDAAATAAPPAANPAGTPAKGLVKTLRHARSNIFGRT